MGLRLVRLRIGRELREGVFRRRLTRFSALVERGGREEMAYLPNSGRMRELLLPGRTVLLAEQAPGRRKTRYDLVMVAQDGFLVSVDARLPSVVIQEALKASALPPFAHYHSLRREATFGDSRLDFLLSDGTQDCLLEVKSVTLIREGVALFPDAPTLRGTRHLRTLIRAKQEGYEAAVIFLVQREDALCFRPNDATDPAFGHALRQAREAGVGIYCYRCEIAPEEVRLVGEVPLAF